VSSNQANLDNRAIIPTSVLRPFDIVLIGTKSATGHAIKLAARPQFSHAALYIGRNLLLEASSASGVCLRELDVLENRAGETVFALPGARGRVLRHTGASNVEFSATNVHTLAFKFFGLGYAPIGKLAVSEHKAGPPLESVFCSELVARALAEVGLLASEWAPENTTQEDLNRSVIFEIVVDDASLAEVPDPAEWLQPDDGKANGWRLREPGQVWSEFAVIASFARLSDAERIVASNLLLKLELVSLDENGNSDAHGVFASLERRDMLDFIDVLTDTEYRAEPFRLQERSGALTLMSSILRMRNDHRRILRKAVNIMKAEKSLSVLTLQAAFTRKYYDELDRLLSDHIKIVDEAIGGLTKAIDVMRYVEEAARRISKKSQLPGW
jgi:hypothetical protein